MQFNERLKELRKLNNWTQEDLANKLNISAPSVGLYEQGRRNPDNKMLKKIASLFNVSVDYLIGFERHEDYASIDTHSGKQTVLFPQFFEETISQEKQKFPVKVAAYNNESIILDEVEYAMHGEMKNMTHEQKLAMLQMIKTMNASNDNQKG